MPLAEPDGVVTEPDAVVLPDGDVAVVLVVSVEVVLEDEAEGAGVVVLGVTTVVESRDAVVVGAGVVVFVVVLVRSQPARAVAPSASAATRGISFMRFSMEVV